MSKLSEIFQINEDPKSKIFEQELARSRKVVDRIMLKLASEIRAAPARDRAASAANFAASDISLELHQLAQRLLSIGGK